MEVPDMRGKHKNHISGENHFRYNKDRIIASNGYVLVRVSKTHPLHNALVRIATRTENNLIL